MNAGQYIIESIEEAQHHARPETENGRVNDPSTPLKMGGLPKHYRYLVNFLCFTRVGLIDSGPKRRTLSSS